jgi:RNA polymerase sigma factor for flagellar operon FliA
MKRVEQMATKMLKTQAYRNDSLETRNKVILEHLPQIKYIAQRISRRLPPEVQLDDLISAGVIGLLDAYAKFDEGKGVQFKTYAEIRIRGEILDSLRGLDWAPRSLRSRSKEIEQAYSELEQRFHRPARDEEVAGWLKIDIETFHSLLDQLNGLTIGHFQQSSADEETFDEDHIPLRYMSNSQTESPFDSLQKQEMREILTEIIGQLPEREQLILSLYYYEELTMKEIGQVLGVNESRVSQLHTRTMLRMRARLQARLREEARSTE